MCACRGVCMCVCVRGGGVTFYIWHSTDVRPEWPPFSALPGIWLAPFFLTKSIWMTRFFWITMWKVSLFWHQRFFYCSLGIQWTDCYICLTICSKWVQKVKGQYMNRSTFLMIKYMNGSVFSKARYMNWAGFEILARTPVPQLSPSYPHPRACVPSDDSDQLAYSRSLIRIFIGRFSDSQGCKVSSSGR